MAKWKKKSALYVTGLKWALYYSKMFNIFMRVSYINTCLNIYSNGAMLFLKNVYPWTKGSFSPLKLLSLDALQNQTPNPQNVKVAYLRSPPAPKFKDLMMASNLHNTSALTQMLKNDSSILCVMKVDYKPINFTKIKFNTLRTLEIFKSLANNMKGQNSSGK